MWYFGFQKSQKMKTIPKILMQKQFWKIFFYKKNVFEFFAQKVTNFCSKKKNVKKYFFYKNKFGKNFFL